MAGKSASVLFLTTFFGLLVVAALGSLTLGLPFPTPQTPYWRTLLIYGGIASYVGYLCWHQSPRARFATYLFLTLDAIQAIRGGHWWTISINLTLILIMQLPAFRAVYPSIQPAHFMRRHQSRQDRSAHGALNPQRGIPPMTERDRASLT